jgi:flavin-dependent dehydrogenase
LLLPQNKTEEVLEEHLRGFGIEVQRPYKAVGMQGDVDEFGNTQVLFESGEVVKAQYVIGADGARSAVSIIITYSYQFLTYRYHVDSSVVWRRLCRCRRSSSGRFARPIGPRRCRPF